MNRRELFHHRHEPDLKLRSPANWTAILFLAALGALHLSMAAHAYLHGRWEGFLSVIFGCVFMLAAVACSLLRTELCVHKDEHEMRLRTGIGSIRYERAIPFARVEAIRLTLLNKRSASDSLIEVVCKGEVIECPPTGVPRQEALCLAMLMDVRLIKVYGHDVPNVSERIDKLTSA
ncbi:MAG TPA: hypothetical protein VF669_14005 [Tepidisphaeraceae bacterium]|jgi:hypothetical protein